MRRSSGQSWWSDLGKAVAVCTAFAVLISAAGVRAAEKVATNIDLMQDLTAGVIGELHGKFAPMLNGRAVRLKPAGSSEDYYFVTNVFREELMRLGVTTLEPLAPLPAPVPASPVSNTAGTGTGAGTSTNPAVAQQQHNSAAPSWSSTSPAETDSTIAGPVLVLQYQNVVFDLKYVDSHRAFMVGGRRVERRAGVRIMTTLSDETGRVLWVGEAERDHEDEIDYGDAARVEQGMYQFNSPVVPSGGWGKVVEPVFVTGVIVGLIYLFFSNQSDN